MNTASRIPLRTMLLGNILSIDICLVGRVSCCRPVESQPISRRMSNFTCTVFRMHVRRLSRMVAFHVIDVSARDGLSSQNGVKGNIAYQAIERSANQWHKGDVS